MRSFLWLRLVSTQLTFGIRLYTVTLSDSSGSKLPLAEDIRLFLCFIAFHTDCESPETAGTPITVLLRHCVGGL